MAQSFPNAGQRLVLDRLAALFVTMAKSELPLGPRLAQAFEENLLSSDVDSAMPTECRPGWNAFKRKYLQGRDVGDLNDDDVKAAFEALEWIEAYQATSALQEIADTLRLGLRVAFPMPQEVL